MIMKLNKITFALALSTTLVGCANLDDSFQATEQNFQQYEAISQQYDVNENWWSLYQDPQLDRLVQMALENNKDLAKAAVSVNSALYQANLLGADLVPSFSGQVGSSAQKNINTGGNSTISHSGSLSVSYTLDLWRRLADAADAGAWTHAATVEDLAATRLSLINSVITTYYQIAYLKDAIKVSEQSLGYYNQISTLMQNRWRQGVVDRANYDQTQQSVLTAKNTLISYQTQLKTAEQTMRNLLNLTPSEALNLHYPAILNVKLAGVNLNVPVSAIANRPDVKGYEYRLRSAFKDAKATQKSWFPSITLGGSLSSSGNKIDNAFNTPIAGGTVAISLPFLSWNTVKWNVKISEAAYETAKLNFEQAITTALNEIDANYYSYSQSLQNFDNLQQRFNYDKRITQYYKNRYDAGVSELSDWLSAINDEKSSELSILSAKYTLIQNENAVYSAMGGYYAPYRLPSATTIN